MTIRIQRAYEDPDKDDGYRVLVDRIWPRGRSKDELALDDWQKELAPSTELRKWFGHDPERWKEFQKRYRSELNSDEQQTRLADLLAAAAAAKKDITLVYGAKDTEHNQAVVLRELLGELQRKKSS